MDCANIETGATAIRMMPRRYSRRTNIPPRLHTVVESTAVNVKCVLKVFYNCEHGFEFPIKGDCMIDRQIGSDERTQTERTICQNHRQRCLPSTVEARTIMIAYPDHYGKIHYVKIRERLAINVI